ncbi:carboxysome protein CcmN [Geminocystis sp. NIES-3708]|uniref:hypothetical protein n=1 Tax=Geminocystis sp. NIES-3708 TaxID=1615909 RepID=UPI0005FC51E8|nr:hypothetical protein [Geminocystis sp. NIES-3708]BAQ60287.1 carboxysome protein CcmN [Geminocystis sp. NIES-3708]
MSLPILQPSTIDTTQIRGDVTIDQSVVIASGVILSATSGNKIVIRQGVCVGMGTIITAYQGDIEIQENTILGSGSLILGNCTIGSQVSLGASVTVYNENIEAMSVIPAGSIIGDRSRQVSLQKKEVINFTPDTINSPTQSIIDGIKNGFGNNLEQDQSFVAEKDNQNLSETEIEEILEEPEKNNTDTNKKSTPSTVTENQEAEAQILNNDNVQEENSPQGNTVVGKVYINKLLFTLFPDKHKI